MSEKVHASAADRQKAYRNREKILRGAVERFREVITHAANEAGMARLVDNLPEEPTDWLNALSDRLEGRALVVFRRRLK